MTAKEIFRWRLLRLLPRMLGKDNAKTRLEIREMLGEKNHSDATDSGLRAEAKVLLNEYEIPLCSGRHGFYMATCRADLLEFRENLQKRMDGLKRNLKTVKKILRKNPRYSVKKAIRQISHMALKELQGDLKNPSPRRES